MQVTTQVLKYIHLSQSKWCMQLYVPSLCRHKAIVLEIADTHTHTHKQKQILQYCICIRISVQYHIANFLLWQVSGTPRFCRVTSTESVRMQVRSWKSAGVGLTSSNSGTRPVRSIMFVIYWSYSHHAKLSKTSRSSTPRVKPMETHWDKTLQLDSRIYPHLVESVPFLVEAQSIASLGCRPRVTQWSDVDTLKIEIKPGSTWRNNWIVVSNSIFCNPLAQQYVAGRFALQHFATNYVWKTQYHAGVKMCFSVLIPPSVTARDQTSAHPIYT